MVITLVPQKKNKVIKIVNNDTARDSERDAEIFFMNMQYPCVILKYLWLIIMLPNGFPYGSDDSAWI